MRDDALRETFLSAEEIYHGKIIEDIEIGGMNVERQSIDYEGLKFKISINVVEVDNQYRIFCEYNDQLYSPTLINTFLDSIAIVLNKFHLIIYL